MFAAEADVQDETMAILDEVVGISTAEYATSLNSLVDNQFRGLAQKEVDINLVSAEGGVRVRASFVKDNLRQIYFSDHKEEYLEEWSIADTVGMAEGFLESYQNYVGNAFYSELASMLYTVDATKNATESAENIMLEVLNSDQTIVDYVWTYVDENGIAAESKNVILSYDKGCLKVFLNNWPLYTIVGEPKLSGEEATAIALEAAKSFSYDVATDKGPSTVSGFDIAPESLGHESLSYLNFPDPDLARGGDPFTLYPSWYVPIGFNQSYHGAVTGMTVTVWADTGEVSDTDPMVVNFPSEISADNEAITDGFNQGLTMLAVPIMVTALSGVFGVVALVSKKKTFKVTVSRKLLPKFLGTLMCGIIVFSAVLVATPQVAAIMDPDSKAEIYAAYGSNPPQLQSEVDAAEDVAEQIEDAFENAEAGYTADDLSGDDTVKSDILNNIDADEAAFDRVSVFHFGHMAYGFGLGFQDDDADNISASEVSERISSTKHDFVMLYVCGSAQDFDSGLSVAWTNRTDLSYNGYLYPDQDKQAYLGFYNFSPQIGNESGTFEDEETGPFSDWIEDFYDYALCDGYSEKCDE
ncbi:hypothetical protein JW988_05390 [Candidatus Bathyarchaeota archaeon]|nr:hypothetical protein [Candidatus Bathyarchaeota archaeon]